MVKSYVVSKLDFCNALYANVSKTLLTKLQRVLNASVRFIFNIPTSEDVNFYSKELHLLPVKYRIIYKLCVIVFKILNGLAPKYLQDKVTLKAHDNLRIELRSAFDFSLLELPIKYRNACQYKLAEHWNALPISIRESSSINIFCSLLKTHLFQHAYF